MMGLDTNVLVRYLVQDDEAQCKIVNRELERAVLDGERFVISPIVLCELVWVLETAYSCSKNEVIDILEKVLRTAQFEILEKDAVWGAWDDYRDAKGDFSDYYVGRRHCQAGVDVTLTFDKALKKSAQFRVLGAAIR
jgi:predicted nucleic-acid-binding protein